MSANSATPHPTPQPTSQTTLQPTAQAELLRGAQAIIPLVIASLPFGLIFGALGITGGLSAAAVAAMSAIVFAGSSQFVAVGLLATATPAWVIILTTLVVNLRHMLYGASLAHYFRALPQRWLAFIGFTLTDEAYITTINHFHRHGHHPLSHWYYTGAAAALYVNWQFATLLGIWAGRAIPNPASWGLDFVFPAAFLGMLVPQIRTRPVLVAALVAAVVALLGRQLPHQTGLIAATLAGVIAGVWTERRQSLAPQPTPPLKTNHP